LESLVLVMTENPELRYHPKGLQYGILSQAWSRISSLDLTKYDCLTTFYYVNSVNLFVPTTTNARE
jgi:hypothetical protein